MPEESIHHKSAEKPTEHERKGKILLAIARNAIARNLGRKSDSVDETQPWLHEKGASFVTLTMHQHLRGCIGSLEAHRPLLLDVKDNAYAAAFRDFRFAPLTASELDATEIEVSLLSPQQPIIFKGEADALTQLRPHIDGIVFQYGHYRSTFLPQVWEQLSSPSTFMAHLKHKAGLPPDFWHDEVELYRYTVTKFKEEDIKPERNSNTESLAS